MTSRRRPLAIWAAAIAVSLSACATGDGRTLRPPTEPAPPPPADAPVELDLVENGEIPVDLPVDADLDTIPTADIIELYAPWIEAGTIDTRYGCDGSAVSPLLTWSSPPPATAELVMVASDVTDRDGTDVDIAMRVMAPLDPDDPIHWMIVGIDPATRTISEGGIPEGAGFMMNAFGEPGWTPPCPPEGDAMDLRFSLVALSEPLGDPAELDAIGLAGTLDRIAATTITSAISLGTYQR